MAKVSIEQVSQHPEKFDWDEWRKQMEDIFKDITKPQPTPEPTPQPEEPPEQEEEPIEVIDDYFEVQSHISLLHKQGFKGKGIKVGVIDTGIAYKDHPAIKGRIIAGFSIIVVVVTPCAHFRSLIAEVCLYIRIKNPIGHIDAFYFINMILAFKHLWQQLLPLKMPAKSLLGSLLIKLKGDNIVRL